MIVFHSALLVQKFSMYFFWHCKLWINPKLKWAILSKKLFRLLSFFLSWHIPWIFHGWIRKIMEYSLKIITLAYKIIYIFFHTFFPQVACSFFFANRFLTNNFTNAQNEPFRINSFKNLFVLCFHVIPAMATLLFGGRFAKPWNALSFLPRFPSVPESALALFGWYFLSLW